MGIPVLEGYWIGDKMMLLSLTLALTATLANSKAGITYTAEPFNSAPKISGITYTAEPFAKTDIKQISKAAVQPITSYTSLPRTYMPINNFNSLSTTSYPYSLPLTYNTQYPMSNIYTNSFPLANNWFASYNIKPSKNIVPASTRTIPSIASTRAIPSISSPLVKALYNPAVVQPLKAIKQMTKREAEPGMTYTAEPFDSKMTMTYTAEPFKSTANKVTPSETKTINTVTGYTGLPLNYASYTYPMTYTSMANPTYSTPYSFPSNYGYLYMYNSDILPSAYTYTHPSNYGLCLNNLGAQVPC